MDGPTFDQSDLDRLSVKDKQELQQFITNEQQKARIQQRMRQLLGLPFTGMTCS